MNIRPVLYRSIPLTCVAGLLASPALRSQSRSDTARIYILDPIVVTATKSEALRSRVPNAVTLITGEEIKSSGETSVLPLISRRVPGAFVTERGVLGYGVSTGAAGTIMIRGTGASPNTEVLVMTDGRPQMMGLMGHPLPDTYVSAGVERVEVIRGPASLLYGTNAMGGVVNIIYEKPTSPGFGGGAAASAGSFNTQRYEVGGTVGMDGGGISVAGNHYRTDGHRPYASFKSSSLAVRGNAALDEHFALSADISVTGFRTFDPGPAPSPRVNNWADITRGSTGISVENRHAHFSGALKTFLTWGRHDLFDGFHSNDYGFGLYLHEGTDLWNGGSVTAGLDLKRYGGRAENRLRTLDYGTHAISETGLYLLFRQQFGATLNLSGGIRGNRHQLFGWEAVPQIGLAFQATSSTTIKGFASKGFRSPTIRELYLFPAPTPTLGPERLWNYELSVLQIVGEVAHLELTGFTADGTNVIRTTGAFPNLALRNSGTFLHRGIEFSGHLRPSPTWSLDCAISFLDPGEQTNANPKQKAHVAGSYAFDPVTITAGVQYVASLHGDDFGRKPLPDYALLNVRATADVGMGLSVYIAGENLLDRPYQILADYPMPGRTLFAGLNWGWRDNP